MSDVDIESLQAWVGREQIIDDDLHPDKAVALAAMLDHKSVPRAGEALPLPWHWLYFLDHVRASDIGSDGHPKTGGFLPPVPFPRRMWASGKIEIHEPLVLGESARRVSRIESVEYKQGRSGELIFVTVTHSISQNDRLCLHEHQHLVYRRAADRAQPLPPGRASTLAENWRQQRQIDPVLLFRYSALTGNSHRIHYDRDYAMNEEFYPALVVHGPLQATLLLDALRSHAADVRMRKFSFRAQRPLFDTDVLSVCGQRDGDTATLWTESHDGFVAMTVDIELASGGATF